MASRPTRPEISTSERADDPMTAGSLPAGAARRVEFYALMQARTLAQKLWDSHVVETGRAGDEPDLLYVDLHLVHEVTSPQAFEGLRMAGRHVRRPDLTVATMDHNVPTRGGVRAADDLSRKQMDALEENCRQEGVPLHKIGSRRQGIVHV